MTIIRPGARDLERYIHLAFEQLRLAAAPHPAISIAILNLLSRLLWLTRDRAHTEGEAAIRAQADAVLDEALRLGHGRDDVRRIEAAAEEFDLDPDLPIPPAAADPDTDEGP